MQLIVWFVNITTLTQVIDINTITFDMNTAVTCLCRCGGKNLFTKIEKSVFYTFLKEIKNDEWRVEQRTKKIESDELLRIFPINTVVGARKVTEENKDRKKFSLLYK